MAKYKRPYKRKNSKLPDEEDLRKLELDKSLEAQYLDEDGRITEKKAVQMLRSVMRQVWLRAPNKKYFLLLNKTPNYDPDNRRLWEYQCNHCKEWFTGTEIEVDHIHGEHKFTKLDEFTNFFNNVMNAPTSAFQILCKPCHEIKTVAERNGITFEEAKFEKRVIAFGKLKVNEQNEMLRELIPNVKDTDISNGVKRKNVYRNYLKEIANE